MIDHVMCTETIQVISRPMRQNVPFGGTASFNCVGYGSFLDIIWRFDFPSDAQDLVFCSRESCDHIALSYYIESAPSSDNLISNTTLEIDTSLLELDGIYPILCILQETVPAEYDLEEGMDQPFSATLTIMKPPSSTISCK